MPNRSIAVEQSLNEKWYGMIRAGRRWTIQDRFGHEIYLTDERWQHIIDADNHPELSDYEDLIRETIRLGRRRQEPLNQRKYRYYRHTSDLPDDFNHVVVIVLFGFTIDDNGQSHPNNYVATAFFKYIDIK